MNRKLLELSRPQNFDSEAEDNVITRAEITFEHLCSTLEANGVTDARNLTALQFYLRLDYFKKQQTRLHKHPTPEP